MLTITVLLYFKKNWLGRVVLVSAPSIVDLPKGDDVRMAWKAVKMTGSPHPLPMLRFAEVSSDKNKYRQLPSSNAAQIDADVLNSQPLNITVTIPAEYGQGGAVITGDTTIRNRGATVADVVIKYAPAFLAGLATGLAAASLLHLTLP
jgi:hypothetical protein